MFLPTAALVKSILMGIIEGITEFLPISSTGHMIIAEQYIKLSDNEAFVNAFEIIIQLGAILAVIWLFWTRLWPFSGSRIEKKAKWSLWFRVIAAVVPAILLGLKFHKEIEAKFFNPTVVACTLIFYGFIIILLEIYNQRKPAPTLSSTQNITYGKAILVGLFQCLAMIPGTSRSAATIIGGQLVGFSRPLAAEFSFFLAIPTMIGASALTLMKQGLHFSSPEWTMLSVGFLTSFLVAVAIIKIFILYIQRHDFKWFGYYRIALGILILLALR